MSRLLFWGQIDSKKHLNFQPLHDKAIENMVIVDYGTLKWI